MGIKKCHFFGRMITCAVVNPENRQKIQLNVQQNITIGQLLTKIKEKLAIVDTFLQIDDNKIDTRDPNVSVANYLHKNSEIYVQMKAKTNYYVRSEKVKRMIIFNYSALSTYNDLLAFISDRKKTNYNQIYREGVLLNNEPFDPSLVYVYEIVQEEPNIAAPVPAKKNEDEFLIITSTIQKFILSLSLDDSYEDVFAAIKKRLNVNENQTLILSLPSGEKLCGKGKMKDYFPEQNNNYELWASIYRKKIREEDLEKELTKELLEKYFNIESYVEFCVLYYLIKRGPNFLEFAAHSIKLTMFVPYIKSLCKILFLEPDKYEIKVYDLLNIYSGFELIRKLFNISIDSFLQLCCYVSTSCPKNIEINTKNENIQILNSIGTLEKIARGELEISYSEPENLDAINRTAIEKSFGPFQFTPSYMFYTFMDISISFSSKFNSYFVFKEYDDKSDNFKVFLPQKYPDDIDSKLSDLASDKKEISKTPENVQYILILYDDSSSMIQLFGQTDERCSSVAKKYVNTFIKQNYIYQINQKHCICGISKEIGENIDFERFGTDLLNNNDMNEYKPCSSIIDRVLEAAKIFDTIRYNDPNELITKRIFLVTDGEDASSKEDGYTLAEELLNRKVILDTFLLSESPHSKEIAAISIISGGYPYSPKTIEEGINILKQETFIDVSMRQNCYVRDSLNKKYYDCLVKSKAILDSKLIPIKYQMPDKLTTLRFIYCLRCGSESIRDQRILAEIREINKESEDFHQKFEIFAENQRIAQWLVFMTKNEDNYKNKWIVSMHFPENYPYNAPVIRFITKNDKNQNSGRYMLDQYSVSTKIINILNSIYNSLPKNRSPMKFSLSQPPEWSKPLSVDEDIQMFFQVEDFIYKIPEN